MPVRVAEPRAIILFGPPGSGKGTQAKLIRQCLGVPHISTGDMLRERMQQPDAIGRQIRSLVDDGKFVTDELANQLVDERIARPDCAAGFILDGYPRTLSQAETICRLLGDAGIGWLVIHLKVDYTVIIARLAGRRYCARCAAVFNVVFNPPKTPDTCDQCGSLLAIRDDDRESVVRRRLSAYDEQTRPLMDFFAARQGRNASVEIDGATDSPAVIAERISGLVRQMAVGPARSAGAV